mmetsp:Transcript_32112/g.104299  ORF Transcript_32112/g.104299 Transcript_32112/m.104299 type:complete len:116 (+) Transcript_32112:924-1271(+)
MGAFSGAHRACSSFLGEDHAHCNQLEQRLFYLYCVLNICSRGQRRRLSAHCLDKSFGDICNHRLSRLPFSLRWTFSSVFFMLSVFIGLSFKISSSKPTAFVLRPLSSIRSLNSSE